MKTLIKQVTIQDSHSPHYTKTVDVLITDGSIENISPQIDGKDADIIDAKGLWLIPGLTDIGVHGGEPGLEHRETVKSLLQSAAAGGFTKVYSFPNLHPVTHSVSEIEYLKRRAEGHVCELFPLGAISQDCKGMDISEMLDMQSVGIHIFTDGKNPVQHGGMMLRALLYVKSFDGLIMNQSLDESIFPKGHLHEGEVSTQIGLRGIPEIAETVMLQRDLDLLEYTQSRLHVLHVSSARSVELIRQAKEKGLRVTASVPVWNLLYTDEVLLDFESNYKLNPPLRAEQDRLALIAGLKDGTLDCITSGHTPLELEKKALEFPYATPGAISLQTAFALSLELLKDHLSAEEIIQLWTSQSASVMGQQSSTIKKNESAGFFLYSPTESWTLSKKTNTSLSINSPLWSKELTGRVKFVANNGKISYI